MPENATNRRDLRANRILRSVNYSYKYLKAFKWIIQE